MRRADHRSTEETAAVESEPQLHYPALVLPSTVQRTVVRIRNNGIALDADLYRPKGLEGDVRAPAVVLSHGWGGSKATGERYAAKFAAAGIVSLCFSHAGWGASDGRVVLVDDRLDRDDANEGIARVRMIREQVDPVEWRQGFRCAVDYLEGEPNVDADRLGAWGTSYGGGIALHAAADDTRIKALAVQVAFLAAPTGPLAAHARQRAIDMARGRIDSAPQGIDGEFFPRLAGTPHLARFLQHDPIDQVGRLTIPTLMLDAGDEDLFDNREHGGRAFEILKRKQGVPVGYRTLPGIDHYGIYFEGFDEGSEAALAWFVEHLRARVVA
jgi:dienelactone hydrolase